MRFKIYLLILFAPFLINACSQNTKQVQTEEIKPLLELLGPKEFAEKLKTQAGVLIDIRTASEHKKGIIPEALLLDFFSENFEFALDKLDKSKIYYIYCASGGRSSEASELMLKKGFMHIVDLDGGIKKWKEANFPIQAYPN
jgi:rhodanese-related sulfurtransferase